MDDYFSYGWREDDGLFIQAIYWTTNGRFFRKVIEGGRALKTRRISAESYFSAWECYMNY